MEHAMITASPNAKLPPQAVDDIYPSRANAEPEILERRDPVVYGHAADGPLSAGQLAEFERRGFLVLPALLSSAEVQACRSELVRLEHCESLRQRAEAVFEPEAAALRSLFAPHCAELSPLFARVAADERLAGAAQQILASRVYVHQSRVNLKPGFVGREFYWHSDFETWHVEDGMPRMRAVSCSILLTDNHEFNGPLMLVPGSHRKYVACVGETPDDHYQQSLRSQQFGVPDNASLCALVDAGGICTGVGPAGTVLLFDCNVMHGSNGNITPFPRSNLFFVYNSVENRLGDPFCGKRPRPEFVASRQRCPVIEPCPVHYEATV
jgi:ectoine hydroxylase